MAKVTICPIVIVMFVLAGHARADDAVSLAAAPPVVVRTVPEGGTDGVDPGLTEITVTYSKDMADGSWSWSTWGTGTFPELTGKPRYRADKRTCVLPVKLKPGHTYATWLNSENFGNFKDADGRSAVPYLLIFKTRSAVTTAPTTRPLERADATPVRPPARVDLARLDATIRRFAVPRAWHGRPAAALAVVQARPTGSDAK